ncbi:hypothetical protein MLPF_1552 [Mycobacterium lepromatosis]|nr:hypothetical protein MLPF_1552 [Mycobacterium lepromatosis]
MVADRQLCQVNRYHPKNPDAPVHYSRPIDQDETGCTTDPTTIPISPNSSYADVRRRVTCVVAVSSHCSPYFTTGVGR